MAEQIIHNSDFSLTEIHHLSNQQYQIVSNTFIITLRVFELTPINTTTIEYIYKIELYIQSNILPQNNNDYENNNPLYIPSNQEIQTFCDNIILINHSKELIFDTIKTLYKAFECPNFIEYDQNLNQFRFKFIEKNNIVSLTKCISLSRKNRTKKSAMSELKNRYNNQNIININNPMDSPFDIEIECVNAYDINDPNYDFEITMQLNPGQYEFYEYELFKNIPVQIYVRDYKMLRYYYDMKLKTFLEKNNILFEYICHLKNEINAELIKKWTINKCETGPMKQLKEMLCNIEDTSHDILNNIFDLCDMEINSINEQTICDFICLGIKFYISQKCNDINYCLDECERSVLSLILSYLNINDISFLNNWKQHLTSGLFTMFENSTGKNGLIIDPLLLKTELVKQLKQENLIVTFKYYTAILIDKQDEITFFMNVETEQELLNKYFPDILLFDQMKFENKLTFQSENKFRFFQRNIIKDCPLGLVIPINDETFCMEWGMWAKKRWPKFDTKTKGYWKILNKYDDENRVPYDHLNAILMLLKHNQLTNINITSQKIRIAFFKNELNKQKNKFIEKDICAEYVISYWNGQQQQQQIQNNGNDALALKILKTFNPASKIKPTRDNFFIHYMYDNMVDWLCYNNEIANYDSYKLLQNELLLKQLECTYQAVIDFPFDDPRFQKHTVDEIRLFNSAQLTELSKSIQIQLNTEFMEIFLLRFTFENDSINITNIAQVAHEQYPKNVKRRVNGINCVFGQQQRLCDVGVLMIHLTKQYIDVCIKFEKNEQEGIQKMYHFSCSICINDENKLIRLLEYWRKDNLFYIDINTGNIQQTLMSFHDRIAPTLGVINNQEILNNLDDEIQCTLCNYYYSQPNNELLMNYSNDKIIQTYDELKHNSKCLLSSEEWDILDEFDQKCELLMEDSKQNIWLNYWTENHSQHNFNQKLFETVCLTKVQKIISMLKLYPNNKPIIVALSNQTLFKDFFGTEVNVELCENKSLSHIFDGNDITKIDSKGNIYNILINNFKEILYGNYYHKFMQIASKLYMDTMIIFTRPNKPNNIYIAYNGYIRLLSLALNNEDLHYFLPQFIPLRKGLFIDVEFNVCDCGTIINYNYLKDEKDIIYHIRCDTNVVYLLNYYQLLNKIDPDIYYETHRKSLIAKYFVKNNNIKLWKTKPPKQNPTDRKHPFHSIFLSIIESAKQCIASIQSNNKISNEQFCMINHQLQQSGIILLFHRTFFKQNNEKVEQYKKENEMYENNQQTKPNLKKDSTNNNLSKLINYLQNEKCINNINKYANPIELTYDNLCDRFASILEHIGSNNKVLVFKLIEHQKEALVERENDNKTDDEDDIFEVDKNEDEDDCFVVMEVEDGQVREVMTYDIIATSTFECVIEYEFEMISDVIHTPILTIEDIMIQLIGQKWSREDHKLLTRFYEFNIYNQYDLDNKMLIEKMKNDLMQQKQLYKKFMTFIQQFNNMNCNSKWLKQRAINTVEVARNAKCLQKYIDEYKNKDEENVVDNTLIIAYNPLQTVIIQSNIVQDVIHSVHLYGGAIEEEFYPMHMLSDIYAEWMEIFDFEEYEKYKFEHDEQERYKTVIDCLSIVLNSNNIYDIILVPSWINLNELFLSQECEIIAIHHEAIQKEKILFLYKGNFYKFDEEKHNEKYEVKMDDNCEQIYMDNVKLVLRHLYDNVSHNYCDIFEPNMAIFDENKKDIAINDYELMREIKKSKSNILFKWLNIGCGECYLNEMNGNISKIEATNIIITQQKDYESAFAKELQLEMFMNYMDCRIPFNSNIISDDKRCAICRDLQVKPSNIGHNECRHSFCKRCIQQWKQMRQNKIDENNYSYNARNDDDNDNDNNCPQCPICKREIKNICVNKQKEYSMKQGIPLTIYQQILDENEGRYMRLHAIDNYNAQEMRDRLYAEAMENGPLPQNQLHDRTLQEQYDNNPQMAHRDAGYQ